ncbi:hypothetical protein NC661_17730 [Aquibacillus koreensis]|uniref:YxiS n=1 Tax=Aquibacillus koreensis TaxID=279446 RepID=A0A9X3WLY4_9BACI|nr:hypothetical protein [Aquibacillus koreensis]MCT2534914.1 hypothetical protein [Aquibacillus koreensis]MDC3422192.1 hypothetical protein [Aquibacillus koreensis]
MDNKELEKKIIDQYQQDENMMILVFAQWCVNNDLDPEQLYLEAYPKQRGNLALQKTLELTVSKEEADEIPTESVLGVLQLFGNDDLAFIVHKYLEKK